MESIHFCHLQRICLFKHCILVKNFLQMRLVLDQIFRILLPQRVGLWVWVSEKLTFLLRGINSSFRFLRRLNFFYSFLIQVLNNTEIANRRIADLIRISYLLDYFLLQRRTDSSRRRTHRLFFFITSLDSFIPFLFEFRSAFSDYLFFHFFHQLFVYSSHFETEKAKDGLVVT